jgi:hypothetical protein
MGGQRPSGAGTPALRFPRPPSSARATPRPENSGPRFPLAARRALTGSAAYGVHAGTATAISGSASALERCCAESRRTGARLVLDWRSGTDRFRRK